MDLAQSQCAPSTSSGKNSSAVPAAARKCDSLLSLDHRPRSLEKRLSTFSGYVQNRSHYLSSYIHRSNPSNRLEYLLYVLSVTVLGLLLTVTVQLGTQLVTRQKTRSIFLVTNQTSNSTRRSNQTKLYENHEKPFRFFFASVWFFNSFLLVTSLLIHWLLTAKSDRTKAGIFRECLRVFNDGKYSSSHRLLNFVTKTCSLCVLWYLSCYMMFRSMSILLSSQWMILYSIKVTLRQILGWIFLQEQFKGHKIIAHILAWSGLLCLGHDNGFRFGRFLFGLSMMTCAVAIDVTVECLAHGFVGKLTNSRHRLIIINMCFCGSCLLWPLIPLFDLTQFEPVDLRLLRSFPPIIALVFALLLKISTVTTPVKYKSFPYAACFVVALPSVSIMDRCLWNTSYSPLFILAIICSLVGVLLSMVPSLWLPAADPLKVKQTSTLINKDANTSAISASFSSSTGTLAANATGYPQQFKT